MFFSLFAAAYAPDLRDLSSLQLAGTVYAVLVRVCGCCIWLLFDHSHNILGCPTLPWHVAPLPF
jgi:hypothetical protein